MNMEHVKHIWALKKGERERPKKGHRQLRAQPLSLTHTHTCTVPKLGLLDGRWIFFFSFYGLWLYLCLLVILICLPSHMCMCVCACGRPRFFFTPALPLSLWALKCDSFSLLLRVVLTSTCHPDMPACLCVSPTTSPTFTCMSLSPPTPAFLSSLFHSSSLLSTTLQCTYSSIHFLSACMSEKSIYACLSRQMQMA